LRHRRKRRRRKRIRRTKKGAKAITDRPVMSYGF
jgi:hypothetical protein